MDRNRVLGLMQQLKLPVEAFGSLKMLWCILRAEGIAYRKNLAHAFNIVRREQIGTMPVMLDAQNDLLEELADLVRDVPIYDFCVSMEPCCAINLERTLEIIESAGGDKAAQVYHLVLLLSCAHPKNVENYQWYRTFLSAEKAIRALDEDAFMDVLYLIQYFCPSKFSHRKNAAAEEICKLLDKLFLSDEEKVNIVVTIKENWSSISRKDIQSPTAYLSKILNNDSSTFRSQRVKAEIGQVIDQFTKSTRIADIVDVLLRSQAKSDDTKAECGFVLPVFEWGVRNESDILVLNPTPTFITRWQRRCVNTPAAFAIRYGAATVTLEKELGAPIYSLEDCRYADRKYSKALVFARGLSDEAAVKHIMSACEISVDICAIVPDGLMPAVIDALPEGRSITGCYLLPSKIFSGVQKKKCLIVIRKKAGNGKIPVNEMPNFTYKRDTYLQFYKMKSGAAIPVDDFRGDKSIRQLYRQYRTVPSDGKAGRNNASEYVFSRELSFWYQASDNEDGTKKLKLYLCARPTEAQRRRNKLVRGKSVKGSAVWRARIPEEEIPDWIEYDGVYRDKLQSAAIRELKLYLTDDSISIKTLWYIVMNRLNLEDDEKNVFQYAMSKGALGSLMASETEAEELEATANSYSKSDIVWKILEAVLEEAVRQRLIRRNPIEKLYEERAKQRKQERAVKALTRRNYTLAEETKIVSFLTDKKQGDKGLALAVLTMFCTGLPANTVAALCWKDFVKITHSSYYQLVVNKRFGKNGELEWITSDRECRRIPIMSFLAKRLEAYRTELLNSGLNEKKLGEKRIFAHKETKYITDQVLRLYRRAEAQAGIESDTVSLPGSTGTGDTDLGKYSGNRFRENFEFRCYTDCEMSEAEVAYLMRQKLPDTFSEYYCDFGHECIQERIAVKLDRWGRRYGQSEAAPSRQPIKRNQAKITAEPGTDYDMCVSIELNTGGKIVIEAESDHGVQYQIEALFRDDFRVTGFQFGAGEKSICIVGSMRGNEYQQIYACSQLVRKLKILEERGRITEGRSILVIPCANPYSVNTKKRFWTIDNTDINRMFPGYDLGETTQRIAGGIFEQIKDYRFGVQFASFYMPGNFVPQVRMMKTGLENVELARQFGLPYVVLHHPRPFDTTTLNYNWQIWETDAFSIYTTSTGAIERESAAQAVDAVLHFMSKQEIIRYRGHEGYQSRVVGTKDFINVRTERAGFFESRVRAGERVRAGAVLATITDPYTGESRQTITAPIDGTVAFVHNETLAYQNTAVFKLIVEEDIL